MFPFFHLTNSKINPKRTFNYTLVKLRKSGSSKRCIYVVWLVHDRLTSINQRQGQQEEDQQLGQNHRFLTYLKKEIECILKKTENKNQSLQGRRNVAQKVELPKYSGPAERI